MTLAAVLPQVQELMIAPRRLPIMVSPEMLAAGRRAFLKQRGKLSDLYDFYECDLDTALKCIFREMTRARI